jgi:glyoxylase-like metal-dependent hydrolase (beta-lactamase superfamily II)
LEHSFNDVLIPMTSVTSGILQEVTEDIACLPIQIVNICFVGDPNGDWILLDAGMPGSAELIVREAEARFSRKPQAIILTHAHFDHVGAIIELIQHWDIPVYAHEKEMPYLTGTEDYPPGDPTVDGGLIAEMSPLFPNEGIDLDEHVVSLPSDGNVPGMPEWRWIHTPGHTPGHISLFREKDRALLAGDAFVTVKQESLYKVIFQEQEISGPPKYFTTNWANARDSVRRLAALKPLIAVTGHGIPMSEEPLASGLQRLVDDFDRIALPSDGRYVH